jgi:hypothetical protein
MSINPTLPLVYVVVYVVDLILVLKIHVQVILYINATRETLEMCISWAVVTGLPVHVSSEQE